MSVTFCIVLLGEGVTKASIPKVFIADFGAQNGHFEYDFWKKYSDFWGRNAATFTKIRTGFLIG